MATLYYYLDECYRKHGDYWHCNIGGAFLPVEDVVDTEIALEEQIYRLGIARGHLNVSGEFKFSNFFRNAPDDVKVEVCAALSTTMRSRGVRFLVSHAFVHTANLLPAAAGLGPPARQVQHLANINLSHYLAPLLASHTVQMIVDLGLSESFRPVYDIYAGALRSIPMMKARGIEDEQITIPHYRQLPAPTFLDSGDSRILQFSDLLIGLMLCDKIGAATLFKGRLLDAITPVVGTVEIFSVEWNATQSQRPPSA